MRARNVFLTVGVCLLAAVAWADRKRLVVPRPGAFRIELVSHGFGQLLPHRIPVPDGGGLPTAELVDIRNQGDLVRNARPTNPVLPPVSWPAAMVLPNGAPGNHFVYATFTSRPLVPSILSSSAAAAVNDQLTGAITVTALDPASGNSVPVRGRAFVGGRTYGSPDPANPGELLLERWVDLDAGGKPVAVDARGLGFPGTEQAIGFAGAADLLGEDTFVFVVDTDGDLTTHETFPAGLQIRLQLSSAVRSFAKKPLRQEGLASATVGADGLRPEVRLFGGQPLIVPGNGDVGVDPATDVEIQFTEPVQPLSVGDLDDGTPPTLSTAVQLQFGPTTGRVDVPFTVAPRSVYDLSRLVLTPLYAFPGEGPALGAIPCADVNQVDVVVQSGEVEDLAANVNVFGGTTFFETGQGPGLVNAPVTPDALYVGRGGAQASLSVIDLNGFGGGTGNPTYDPLNPITEGNSNYPNNPNVSLQGVLLVPPVFGGSCTFDGGSRGVFTLVPDSSLSTELVTAPTVESVGDMALGHPLDLAFNNGSPFGCQAGGGNLCATTGLNQVSISAGPADSVVPTSPPGFGLQQGIGVGNLASWAPHPNPPPMVFPPLCVDPLLAQEPTSVVSALSPPDGPGLTNLLLPSSNPLGIPGLNQPPSGLLARVQNGFWQGPSPPQPMLSLCQPFMQRQQVGQFLYVVDRAAGEVVVLNSNRFTVLARIELPDPTSLAMAPGLDFLAVTNHAADRVSFVDVDPLSSSFHEVVQEVAVGDGPTGIAWSPDNEDVLVCNTLDHTVSVISAFSLQVRKTLSGPALSAPFEVALTPRQTDFGLMRNVWFGYVLNGDGSVAVYESFPDGAAGWGYDDIIGTLPFTFANPKTIQPDPLDVQSGFWVVHEGQLGLDGNPTGLTGGAVTRCAITGGVAGQLPLDPGQLTNPMIRDITWGVLTSIGSDVLTGVPLDLAFDDQNNRSALPNVTNVFSAGTVRDFNGKTLVKRLGGTPVPGKDPQFVFLAVPDSFQGPGVVDVVDLATGQRFDTNPFDFGVQSIPVPDASVIVDYFRQ